MLYQISLFLVLFCSLSAAFAEHTGDPHVRPLAELVYYPERTAPATVISLNESVISAQLDALVAEIVVLVGNRVREGQVMVRLDCADYRIDLKAAQARLDSSLARLKLAESRLQRFDRLLQQQLASQEDRDARAADRDALEADSRANGAARDRTALAVSRCDVKAPYDGLVTERLAAKGQLADVGTPLIALIDQTNIELSAQVSAGDAAFLDRVRTFSFSAGGEWPVQLRSRLSAVNPVTRNREARLVFSGNAPLAGQAGRLQWQDPRPFIPARYVVQREGRYGLFLAVAGRAEFVPVENMQPGRDAPVSLPLDSAVVVAGLATLKQGDSLAEGSDK